MIKWADITADANWASLNSDQQAKVRDYYFTNVLQPAAQANGLNIDEVRTAWDTATGTPASPQVNQYENLQYVATPAPTPNPLPPAEYDVPQPTEGVTGVSFIRGANGELVTKLPQQQMQNQPPEPVYQPMDARGMLASGQPIAQYGYDEQGRIVPQSGELFNEAGQRVKATPDVVPAEQSIVTTPEPAPILNDSPEARVALERKNTLDSNVARIVAKTMEAFTPAQMGMAKLNIPSAIESEELVLQGMAKMTSESAPYLGESKAKWILRNTENLATSLLAFFAEMSLVQAGGLGSLATRGVMKATGSKLLAETAGGAATGAVMGATRGVPIYQQTQSVDDYVSHIFTEALTWGIGLGLGGKVSGVTKVAKGATGELELQGAGGFRKLAGLGVEGASFAVVPAAWDGRLPTDEEMFGALVPVVGMRLSKVLSSAVWKSMHRVKTTPEETAALQQVISDPVLSEKVAKAVAVGTQKGMSGEIVGDEALPYVDYYRWASTTKMTFQEALSKIYSKYYTAEEMAELKRLMVEESYTPQERAELNRLFALEKAENDARQKEIAVQRKYESVTPQKPVMKGVLANRQREVQAVKAEREAAEAKAQAQREQFGRIINEKKRLTLEARQLHNEWLATEARRKAENPIGYLQEQVRQSMERNTNVTPDGTVGERIRPTIAETARLGKLRGKVKDRTQRNAPPMLTRDAKSGVVVYDTTIGRDVIERADADVKVTGGKDVVLQEEAQRARVVEEAITTERVARSIDHPMIEVIPELQVPEAVNVPPKQASVPEVTEKPKLVPAGAKKFDPAKATLPELESAYKAEKDPVKKQDLADWILRKRLGEDEFRGSGFTLYSNPFFDPKAWKQVVPSAKSMKDAYKKIDQTLLLLLNGEGNGAMAVMLGKSDKVLSDAVERLAKSGQAVPSTDEVRLLLQERIAKARAENDPSLFSLINGDLTPEQVAEMKEIMSVGRKARKEWKDEAFKYVMTPEQAVRLRPLIEEVKLRTVDKVSYREIVRTAEADAKNLSAQELQFIVSDVFDGAGAPLKNYAYFLQYSVIMFRRASENVSLALKTLPDTKDMTPDQIGTMLGHMLEYANVVQLHKRALRTWGIGGNVLNESAVRTALGEGAGTKLRRALKLKKQDTGDYQTIADLIPELINPDTGLIDFLKLHKVRQYLTKDPGRKPIKMEKPTWGEIVNSAIYSWMLMSPLTHITDQSTMALVGGIEHMVDRLGNKWIGTPVEKEAWAFMNANNTGDIRASAKAWLATIRGDLNNLPISARETELIWQRLMFHGYKKLAKATRVHESLSLGQLKADATFFFLLHYQKTARRDAYMQAVKELDAKGITDVKSRATRADKIYKEMLAFVNGSYKESDPRNTLTYDDLAVLTDNAISLAQKRIFASSKGISYSIGSNIGKLTDAFDMGTVNRALGIDPHRSENRAVRIIAGAQGLKPLRLLINPFVNTPIQLVIRSFDYAPLVGLVSSGIQGETMKRAVIKQAAGILASSATWFAAYMMGLDDDKITFEYPTSPAERATWEREGKKPFSVKVNGTWTSYRQYFVLIYPLIAQLRLRKLVMDGKDELPGKYSYADIPEATVSDKPKYKMVTDDKGNVTYEKETVSAFDKAVAFGSFQSLYISDQTFMQGMSEWMEYYEATRSGDPDAIADATSRLTQSKARMLIPYNSMLRYFGNALKGATEGGVTRMASPEDDGFINIAETVWANQSLLYQMDSDGLVPKRNIWGKPVKREGIWWAELVLPLMASKGSIDPLTLQLGAWNVNIAHPGKSFTNAKGTIQMSDKMYDKYARQTGEVLWEKLTAEIMADPDAFDEQYPTQLDKTRYCQEVAEKIRKTWRERYITQDGGMKLPSLPKLRRLPALPEEIVFK